MTSSFSKVGWMAWTAVIVALLALAGLGAWRWAVARGAAGTLEWIDARFSRSVEARLADAGRYGADPAQKVELWVPAGHSATPVPLAVFVHGGGWHSGAPENYRFVARSLAEHGYATALVGYRLGRPGRFPAMLEDSAAGVRWAREHARAAGADADRIALMGHSAGAYNVLMLGLDPRWLAAAGVPEDSIAGIVSLAGPADFHPFTSDSAKDALGHAADPRATQPIAFARADAPPILLLHGGADETVRPRNSRNLVRAIEREGGRVQLIELDGMSHAGIVMALSRPFSQRGRVLDPLLAFVRTVQSKPDRPMPAASVPVQRPAT